MSNLPGEATSFVGRRLATAQVRQLVSSRRLVTLTGDPGVGKSRLALRVARGLRRAFPDGAWLVELGELEDASLLGHTVAAALAVPDVLAREPQAALVEYLADKQLLLVLDNCEHLLDTCAHLAVRLLRYAPGLRVLATSRESLGITGEHIWPVPPLSVPNDEACSAVHGQAHRSEALALFEDRASSVVPGFVLDRYNEKAAAALCRQLEGLPLAIELAAVRLPELSVEQILTRIEDRYGLLTVGSCAAARRHQTLRAAVEWSFDLCTELERTLWARLSVFAGEFDLDAAEKVCADAGLPAQDVFPGVARLVDKSILIREEVLRNPSRYRMLDTIRQYGRKRLEERGGQSALRRRHRDYYLSLSEQAEADWFGPHQLDWLNRFRGDQPNLWAALDFCLTEPGEAPLGLRMADTLWCYWISAGIVRDGRYWVDRALALDTECGCERAKALWVAGWIALMQGDIPYGMSALNESADMARRLGDETALACATQCIGIGKTFQNLLPDAVALLEQAVSMHRAASEPNSLFLCLALCQLGIATSILGDTERAVTACKECVAICEAHGERWIRSWALWVLALARWSQGDVRQVGKQARASLRLKRALTDHLGIPFCVELLAWAAAWHGHAERAATLFGMSEKMWEFIGAPLFGASALRGWSNQYKARAKDVLGKQVFAAAYQRGRQFTTDAAAKYALRSARLSTAAPCAPAAEVTAERRLACPGC